MSVDTSGAPPVLVIDPDDTFVGSIGFLAFLALRRHLENGRIVVCNFSDSIRKIFEICRLIPTDPSAAGPFLVEESLEAALARCAA